MKLNQGILLLHVLGGILFLSIPVWLAPGPFSFHSILAPKTQQEFISHSLILGFFYINYYFLIPKFYFPKHYVKYSLLVILALALILILPRIFITLPHPDRHPHPDNHHHHEHVHQHPHHFKGGHHPHIFGLLELSLNIWPFLFVVIFSLIIRIHQRLKETESEKIKAQLSYLTARINPHFLFNTLNSIYALAIEKSDYTPTAIVKLSGMMRYVLSETVGATIALQKELDYISDYIELQKVRFNQTVDIDFNISGDANGLQIAPLILIPYIENAFKHGVNPEEESRIQIKIFIEASTLNLEVVNRIVNTQTLKNADTGLGIENTKLRLEHLYPDQHFLEIIETDVTYSVKLRLDLK